MITLIFKLQYRKVNSIAANILWSANVKQETARYARKYFGYKSLQQGESESEYLPRATCNRNASIPMYKMDGLIAEEGKPATQRDSGEYKNEIYLVADHGEGTQRFQKLMFI